MNVLAPVEKIIADFFAELLQGRTVSTEEISNTEKILSDFNTDNLLPKEELDLLTQKAARLQKKLIAVEYFSDYLPRFPHIFYEVLACYLNVCHLVEEPIKFLASTTPPKNTPPIKDITYVKDINRIDRHEDEVSPQKLQEIDDMLKPLEAQPPLSMILPSFEEEYEVYAFLRPFEERAERAIGLNAVITDLKTLEATARGAKPAVSALLARAESLHADFSRFPSTIRKIISTPFGCQNAISSESAVLGLFSKKTADLTLP
jgi:hypothetical protein